MFELTVGIIGRISVGKSSITKALSEITGIPFTSFGSYLVKYSKIRGLPVDRKSLQDLGEKFIKENPEYFLRHVIEDTSGSTGKIIIEGIRHSVIANEIKILSNKAVLVYIDATPAIRYDRYAKRKKENDSVLSYEEFVQNDNHAVESEIEFLKSACDLVINSEELNINQTVEKIFSNIQMKLTQ